MHVVCDFTLRNRVFDVLEKCVMFCLSDELLDGGMVKEDMDVRNETEGIKFKNLKRKNTRFTISSKTGCDIGNDFVFLIQVRVWIHDVSVRDCAVVRHVWSDDFGKPCVSPFRSGAGARWEVGDEIVEVMVCLTWKRLEFVWRGCRLRRRRCECCIIRTFWI